MKHISKLQAFACLIIVAILLCFPVPASAQSIPTRDKSKDIVKKQKPAAKHKTTAKAVRKTKPKTTAKKRNATREATGIAKHSTATREATAIAKHSTALDETNSEEYDYNHLQNTKESLSQFLRRYPKSQRFNTVSDRLAMLIANTLTANSTFDDYIEAYRYATNLNLRNKITKLYLAACARNTPANGTTIYPRNPVTRKQWLFFGINLIDFGINVASSPTRNNVASCGAGLCLKFGDYDAPVQLELNAAPGVVFTYEPPDNWGDDYMYDDEELQHEFHLPVTARLKLNLASVDDDCEGYIFVSGTYNIVRQKQLEPDWLVGGGLGIAWRHNDLSLYVRKGLRRQTVDDDWQPVYGDCYIGLQAAYYF